MLVATMLGRRVSGGYCLLRHRGGYTVLGWARLHVVPGAESIGRDGTRHDDDGSHLGLIQLDLSTKGFEGRDGVNQTFGVQLGDQTSFGHDVSVPEVGSEIREAVENALKEAVAIKSG